MHVPRLACASVLSMLALSIPALSGAIAGEAPPEALRAVEQREGHATVRWNPETGSPSAVFLSAAVAPTRAADPVKAATAFFDRNHDLFAMREGVDAMTMSSDRAVRGV